MAVTGGIVERFADGPVTMTVGATPVVAGNVVEFSGDREIVPAADGSTVVAGVAIRSGSAQGDKIGVADDGWYDLVADGSITAGAKLAAAGSGKVRVWTSGDGADALIGYAAEDIDDSKAGLCNVEVN